jgi:hypothetical protein
MKAEVTITTWFANHEVLVENDKGMKWRFELLKNELDISMSAAIANIAAAQLAGTITAQLLAIDETTVKYKLEVLTGADCR